MCDCRKKKVVPPPEPTPEPKTPEEQLTIDLNNWNGGPAINENKTDDNG
jgi:hypothetical protein